MLGVSTPSALNALLTGGSPSDKAKANAKLFIEDLSKAGATFKSSAKGKVNFTLNGVSGTIEVKADRVEGKYGNHSVSFRIENDGTVKLDGNNNDALAKINSSTLRRVMGAATGGNTKQTVSVARYNRSGGLLNLLG